jgi:hypothetical protein
MRVMKGKDKEVLASEPPIHDNNIISLFLTLNSSSLGNIIVTDLNPGSIRLSKSPPASSPRMNLVNERLATAKILLWNTMSVGSWVRVNRDLTTGQKWVVLEAGTDLVFL